MWKNPERYGRLLLTHNNEKLAALLERVGEDGEQATLSSADHEVSPPGGNCTRQ